MDVCVPCVWGANGGQKGASDPLHLELLTVVSHPVGAESQTASTLNH